MALTWLRAAASVSAVLGDQTWRTKFVSRARWFYALVRRGWDEKCCGGGMYWGRWSRYKNAVTSELFVDLSGAVYEVTQESRDLEWAIRGWVWFRESGMVNDQGLVNDGLTRDCRYPLSEQWLVGCVLWTLLTIGTTEKRHGLTTKASFSPAYQNYTSTRPTPRS